MPEYLMVCSNGHKLRMIDHMIPSKTVYCPYCDHRMWRKPQPVNVNWGGLRPSQGEITGEIKDQIDNQVQYREEFEQLHEIHEQLTEGD